jgi:hypothetical protein
LYSIFTPLLFTVQPNRPKLKFPKCIGYFMVIIVLQLVIIFTLSFLVGYNGSTSLSLLCEFCSKLAGVFSLLDKHPSPKLWRNRNNSFERKKSLHKFGTSWRSPCYRLEYNSQQLRFICAKSGSILLFLFVVENNILTSSFA